MASIVSSFESEQLWRFMGDASTPLQIQRTGLATLAFFFFRGIVGSASSHFVPQFNQMSKKDQESWKNFSISFLHAVVVSALCVTLVLFPDYDIERDTVYGSSERANLAFSISVGFFLYDLKNCFKEDGTSWGFVFHHLASALCYILVQHPFLQYYAVRLLLYELSTPFLNIRQLLLLLGHKNTPALQAAEKSFGYTFLVVRVFMGLPLSALAFLDVYYLINSGRYHSLGVIIYFSIANLGLNGLNLHWLSLLIKKSRKKSKSLTAGQEKKEN